MTITIPESLVAEAHSKAKAAGFDTVEAYVAYLIIADRPDEEEVIDIPGPPELSPRNRAELEAMIEEGMNSGPPIRVDDAFWARLRERIQSGASHRTETSP